jgi:hypothetical protein
MGNSTSSRPESCVLVVVARVNGRGGVDCGASGAGAERDGGGAGLELQPAMMIKASCKQIERINLRGSKWCMIHLMVGT